MSKLWRTCLILLFTICWFDLASAQQQSSGKCFMVTSGHRLATKQGLKILQQGGNVIDAAVTTSLCLGVAEPYGSGLGGKLVLLYREASSGRVHCIEALCPAPGSISPAAFAALSRNERRRGYHSVGVPGLPAGLYEAHCRWGRLPWSHLVQPAVELARKGVVVEPKCRAMFEPKVEPLRQDEEASRLYLVNNEAPRAGDRLVNEDFARTLEELGRYGGDVFYAGRTARRIVSAAQAAGSPISLDDFSRYQARYHKPICAGYRGYCVYDAASIDRWHHCVDGLGNAGTADVPTRSDSVDR